MLSTFYGDVLPPTGYYALWTKSDKQNTWFESLEDLTRATEELGDTQGVYFATAAYSEQAAINGNKDARTQANVESIKAFRLDLDAGTKKIAKHGADKVYVTQTDALRDTLRMAKAANLPPSYIISSGEGLHLYWVLSEAISRGQWAPVAKKLSRLAAQLNVKQDFAVTTDAARILRPIGTVHENGNEVRALHASRKAYTLENFEARIANVLVTEDEDVLDSPPVYERHTGINKEAMVEGPPKSVKKIFAQCGAMADAMKAKGNVEEPYWRAMLGIVKHTVEGDKAAHFLSSGHRDYDKRATQAKLDNWSTGPTTCAEFAKYSSQCKTCPHRGKIKSPITKGYLSTEQVAALPPTLQPAPPAPAAPTGDAWDGCLPVGFTVVTTGSVNTLMYRMGVEGEDDEGQTVTRYVMVPVTTDIFWFSQWSDASDSEDTAQVFLLKWTGTRVMNYSFDQTLIANQQKFREFLAGKSIIVGSHPKSAKALEEYSKMQLTSIKAMGEMPKVTGRFGMFITDEGNLACAQGEHVISHTGEIRRATVGPELRPLARMFAMPLPTSADAKWGTEVWDSHIIPRAKEHVAFMRKYYAHPGMEKFQLAAMMSMASPLMPFVTGEYISGRELPPGGLTVSLFSSNGGRGKTSLMRAAMLAYGRPQALTGDRNQATSTANGRVARLSIMGTLPVGMDEMGDTTAAACASVVSVVANGVGKERATKDGGIRIGSTFALISLMAANKSARDMIAEAASESNAIQYRLLELDVDDMTEFDIETRDNYAADWSRIANSAGALGAVIHRAICSYGVAAVNRLVIGAVSKASALLESSQTDRIQYRGLGAVMALQAILRSVGMEMFSMSDMVAEFKRAHESGHSYAQEHTLPTDGLLLLNMALHDLAPHTAITMHETRRSRHNTAFDEPLVALPQVVHARHVVSSRMTYVSSTALRDWCAKRKVALAKMLFAAKKENIVAPIYFSSTPGNAQMFNLFKGMRGSTNTSVSCYAFDINQLRRASGKDPMEDMLPEPDSNVVTLHTEPRTSPEKTGSLG